MVEHILKREPALQAYYDQIMDMYTNLAAVFESGNALYTCGNGGSFADSLHIVGELVKSFERDRSVTAAEKHALAAGADGAVLAENLERGLPAVALGTNPALGTALMNDVSEKEILFAQEVFVLGKKGDALLGISTSGNARNVLLAVQAAKARGMYTMALTGKTGGELIKAVDCGIVADKATTREVQQVHQLVYHTICLMLEEHFYA